MRHTMLTLALVYCFCFTAFGRVGASLSGKVTGADGKALPNVNITLRVSHHTPAERSIRTASDGTYTFTNLEPGVYNALFFVSGYESQHITDITTKNEALLLNVELSKSGSWGSSTTSRRYVAETVAITSRPSRYHHKRKAGVLTEETLGAGASGGKAIAAYSGRGYASPIVEPATPGGHTVKSAEVIDKSPTRSVSDIAAVSTTVYKSGSGASMSVAGGRGSGTAYESEGLAMTGKAEAVATPNARPGMLTSGEINDFSKWTLWEDMSMDALKGYRSTWPFRPESRYTVLVKSKTGMPLCNAHVKMSDGSGQIWETVTDNTGKAELWYGMWNTATTAAPRLTASVDYGKEHFNIPALKPFNEGANILATNLSCLNPAKLDMAFIVDATGSMGDEINYLKEELRDILQKVHDSMPATQVQTGALFYRDVVDVYLTRTSDLTPDFNKTEAFIADNSADGGGDFPEAVDAALEEGLNAFHWRTDATARLAFLVLDAPPHSDPATVKRMQEVTAQYAAKGIRLIPVVCSGSDKSTEYLMRSLALATNGTYLFLTDHSGIGGSHTAPTTDKYDVEYLNGLIYRVIYQCTYMPSCNEPTIPKPDTSNVQQKTDSAIINWHYYPNPTTGILHIQHTNTSGYLLITDITGKAIQRVPTDPTGTTTIDLTQYPAGLYAVRYNWTEDKWVSGKFVLTH